MTIITQELLDQYFKKEKRNPAYQEVCKIYEAIRIHANGEYPKDLIDKQRPSEPPEVQAYRKEIFQAVTKETFSRIDSCVSKIRRSSDWAIRFDPKTVDASIPPDEAPEKYFSENYPAFTSITNWLFSVCQKNYLMDANAVCAVIPLNPAPASNEYSKPFPFIFNSDQVFEYIENDFCIIKSKDTSTYVESNVTYHDGEIWWVINVERIIRYEQVSRDKTLAAKLDFVHNLDYMPAFKLGGVFLKSIDMTFIYESRIQPIVPRLNKAIREDNDLDVSVVRHLFPEKWEYVSRECPKCNGAGKIATAEGPASCEVCKGSGLAISSPFQTHVVTPPNLDKVPTIPVPPAGYIQKDVEIIKHQEARIERHTYNALAAINLEFLAKTPLVESGLAKGYDRDESNNTIHYIAEDMVRITDRVIAISYDYRYTVRVPNLEKRKAMRPAINVPERFDFMTSDLLITEYKTLKEAKLNPVLIVQMEAEFATKRFSTDPLVKDQLLAIIRLDPFAGKSSDDKLSDIQNSLVTKVDSVISANIVQFVQRAKFENDKFFQLKLDEQKKVMAGYAQEIITELDKAAQMKIEMQPAPDPNSPPPPNPANPNPAAA